MGDDIRQPKSGDLNRCENRSLIPYRLINSRRFMISAYAITALTVIAITNKLDTAMAIATVASALAASNAFQNKGLTNERKD